MCIPITLGYLYAHRTIGFEQSDFAYSYLWIHCFDCPYRQFCKSSELCVYLPSGVDVGAGVVVASDVDVGAGVVVSILYRINKIKQSRYQRFLSHVIMY